MLAAFSMVGAFVAVLITAGATGIGLLLAKRLTRLTRRPGAPEVPLRESMRRSRAKLREQLTPWERRFFYAYALGSPLLAPVAIGVLLFGSSGMRGLGIGLLLLGLVAAAVPISPFMRARVRRREQRAGDRE